MTFELHYDLISGFTLNFSLGGAIVVFFSIGGEIVPLHPPGYGPVDITLIAITCILNLSCSLKLLNEILQLQCIISIH